MIIPEGDFLMGSSARREDEKPVHNVYINAFEMAVTPVTNSEYRYYSSQTGADLPPWIDEPKFYDDLYINYGPIVRYKLLDSLIVMV